MGILLWASCFFSKDSRVQSDGQRRRASTSPIGPAFGACQGPVISRPRCLVHSRVRAVTGQLGSADLCADVNQDQCDAALRSLGYGADEIVRADDGNLGLVALCTAVLGGIAFFFRLAMASRPESQEESTAARRKSKEELYKTWGGNCASLPSIQASVAQQQDAKNVGASLQQQEAREDSIMLRAASRSAGCRAFWAVDRWGRDNREYNDTYSLFNHINMARDEPRVEAYRSALERTAGGRRVLDVGGGAFCLLSRLALRAGARSVDCVEQSRGSVEHSIDIFKSEEKGVECAGLQGIGASVLEKFSDVSCDDRRDRLGEGPRTRLSLKGAGQERERTLQLFQGLSSDVPLDGGYNLVVHEILGHIASSEGVATVILDLCRRCLLAPDCVFVPRRAVTLCAPTQEIEGTPQEQLLSMRYGGELMDLKCETKYHAARFSEEAFLAAPAIFEDLMFGPDIRLEQTRTVHFATTRDGVFDGLHFHMLVDMGEEGIINTLVDETTWTTTYLRLFQPGIFLPAGSRITVNMHVQLNTAAPEYSVEVMVNDQAKKPAAASFSWSGST